MALFGSSRGIHGRRKMPPPSPYGTRDPAKILAMGEAAQQAQDPMVLEGVARPAQRGMIGASAMPPELTGQAAQPEREIVPFQGATAMPEQPGGPTPQQRQGFDYDAAMKALAGDQRKPKWWQTALAILGDGIAMQNGNPAFAVATLQRREQDRMNRLNQAAATLAGWQYRDYARQDQANLQASRPFTIGRDRLQFNPATGQTNMLYDGQQDFEQYAAT
ncbi:MAG: hypothetical protein HRT64_13515, partial [Erythrobacter sp.]|nr:hypothetical protein [Erythrobacter sp.]